MSEQLLPCPFCGGPVYLERATTTFEQMHGERKWWGVVCRNTIGLGGTCAIEQCPSASKEAAIARWNRRAGNAEYVIDLLVAAGIVSAEKVEEARAIASRVQPPATSAPTTKDTGGEG